MILIRIADQIGFRGQPDSLKDALAFCSALLCVLLCSALRSALIVLFLAALERKERKTERHGRRKRAPFDFSHACLIAPLFIFEHTKVLIFLAGLNGAIAVVAIDGILGESHRQESLRIPSRGAPPRAPAILLLLLLLGCCWVVAGCFGTWTGSTGRCRGWHRCFIWSNYHRRSTWALPCVASSPASLGRRVR